MMMVGNRLSQYTCNCSAKHFIYRRLSFKLASDMKSVKNFLSFFVTNSNFQQLVKLDYIYVVY